MFFDKIVYAMAAIYSVFHSFLYRKRFYVDKSRQEKEKIFLVHIPKTAGQSVVDSMGIKYAAHFPAKNFISVDAADRILVIMRDPAERIESIFKYSKKKNHYKNIFSPLYVIRFFDTFEQFVSSPVFNAFCRHHYFFKPSAYFINGLDLKDHRVLLIDFKKINCVFLKEFGVRLSQKNMSPAIDDDYELSPDSRKKIEYFYKEDYALLDALE